MYAKYLTVVYKVLPFINPVTTEATWNTVTDPIRVALGDVTVPTGPFYRFLYSNPQVAVYIAISAPLFVYLYEITFPNTDRPSLETETCGYPEETYLLVDEIVITEEII